MRRNAIGLVAGVAALVFSSGAALAQAAGSSQSLSNGVGGVQQGAPGGKNPAAVIDGVGGGGGAATSDSFGQALNNSALGDSNSGNGVPLLENVNPADWSLKDGLGGSLVLAGDQALKANGHPDGLAGQGIDSGQITGPLEMKNVVPTGVAAQLGDVMSKAGSILGGN